MPTGTNALAQLTRTYWTRPVSDLWQSHTIRPASGLRSLKTHMDSDPEWRLARPKDYDSLQVGNEELNEWQLERQKWRVRHRFAWRPATRLRLLHRRATRHHFNPDALGDY